MGSRPITDEALVRRIHPTTNPDRHERARAWTEWQHSIGEAALRKFIRLNNNSGEPDDDIMQDSLMTAYIEVERGRYQPIDGVPFTAYVKGIARNKLREARRRRSWPSLEDLPECAFGPLRRQTEVDVEQRERQDVLKRGLTDLDGDRRQVLEAYLVGDSTGEIARRLAMSRDVVRQHKSRGLRHIRLKYGLEAESMWAGLREADSSESTSSVPACPDDLNRS